MTSQPPKFGFAREVWETCPECGGTLDNNQGGWVCLSCNYTRGGGE